MRAFIADEQAIAIVAGPSLSARYQQAFQLLGRQVTTVSGDDAFLAGVRSIVHARWQTPLPLIAILRGITLTRRWRTSGAAIAAGFDTVEIPLNSPQWQQSIPAVVEAYGAQALIGAGTVLQEAQVDRLAQLGARLVVTPMCSRR